MPDVVCAECGHRNQARSRFCSSCGSPLAGERDDRTDVFHPADLLVDPGDDSFKIEREELPAGVGVLVVKSGAGAGSRYPLTGLVTTAGRHPKSDIFLDDITVSRRHVELSRTGDRYTLRDVGSLNGTYVNHRRVEQATLADGDEVQIGKFKLVFFDGPHS